MDGVLLLGSAVLGFLLWTLIALVKNYNIARQIGLPIIVSPVTPLNPFWIITTKLFPRILLMRYLPFGLGKWARCTAMGWTFQDKYALHAELGPLFTIVTPGGNDIVVGDPDAAHTILSRRKEYIKPAAMYEQLNVFGANLNTVEGDDWQRHRRLTAPSFNEKTSSSVWGEALQQAQDMASLWHQQGSKGTRDTVGDTATLALHVLTHAGFGISYNFHEGVRNVSPGHEMTYRDSLSVCLNNIITFAVFPKNCMSLPFLPKRLQRVGQAAQEFQKYMEDMLALERCRISKREAGAGNLMSALVRASEEAKQSSDGGETSRLGLTDLEIFGNIFAYNLAGHETTANTVATALVLLAAHPEYQDWLSGETDQVLGTSGDFASWKYEEAFPRLQRIRAVMYETLRLYGSIVFIPKSTDLHTQTLTTGQGKAQILIPPSTSVSINVQSLHTDPQSWGSDSLAWRPKRWLRTSASAASNRVANEELFIDPAKGTFVPWADGPRVCPGQKFAQVEFTAVLATLFSQYRVRPSLEEGRSQEAAKKELLAMVEGSSIQAITLQMREPRKVGLVWETRGGALFGK